MAEAAASNFKVSATGGAGSAGQPAQYMSSDYERTGDAGNMELQTSAPMSKSGVVTPTTAQSARAMREEPIVPLDAKTQRPDEHPATGAALGPGAGPEALQSTMMLAAQNNEDIAKLAALLPVYQKIAESPNASNATRNYVRWLQSQVTQGGATQG